MFVNSPATYQQTLARKEVVTLAPNTILNVGSGYGLSVALGYRFSPNFRADVEFAYFKSTISLSNPNVILTTTDITTETASGRISTVNNKTGVVDLTFTTQHIPAPVPVATTLTPLAAGSTNIENYAVMFNGYYYFVNDSAFTPHVGAGFGFNTYSFGTLFAGNTPIINAFTAGNFAYQLKVGVAVDLVENLALQVGYRYFATATVKINALGFTNNEAPAQGIGSLDASLRFSF